MEFVSFDSNLILVIHILICLFAKCRANSVEVMTSSGLVRGQTLRVLNQSVNQFLGIPFAEPPIGDLRFAKPKPLSKPLADVIDGTTTKVHACWQVSTDRIANWSHFEQTFSEDCLHLNVWAPSELTNSSCANNTRKLKPVMYFIYGGAFVTGSIYSRLYNGSALAANDVILVSANYRLGCFGFLSGPDETAPGNVGLFDQILALQWIRDNIHLFGGDKDQITMFGQSSGSISVSADLFSPVARGLFKRVILMSGAFMYGDPMPMLSKQVAHYGSRESAKRLNCTDDKTWLACMRSATPQQLVELDKLNNLVQPTEGTEFLPKSALKSFADNEVYKDLEMLSGISKDEGVNLAADLIDPMIWSRKNLTKMYFYGFVQGVNKFFNKLNVDNITKYYLRDVDPNDSDAIKQKVYDFVGDLVIKCPTYLFAKRYAQHSTHKTNVYFYYFNYKLQNDALTKDIEQYRVPGIYHGAETPFIFGIPLLEPHLATETDIKFSEQVVKWLTNFAKYGKPDQTWKPFLTGADFEKTQVKELNPDVSDKYVLDLLGQTCDGIF